MIRAATWLLGKFGLSVAEGKSLMPLVLFVGAVAAVLALAIGGAWWLMRVGAKEAIAACNAEKQVASDWSAYYQGELTKKNETVIVKYIEKKAATQSAADQQQAEVKDYVEANPTVVLCSLNDRGLRLWNSPLGNGGLPVPPGAADPKPGNPAPSIERRDDIAPAKPRGLQASVLDGARETPSAINTSHQLHGRASGRGRAETEVRSAATH